MKAPLCLIICLVMSVYAKDVTILLKMIPEQEAFFIESFLAPFEKKHECTVTVERFADNWELTEKLSAHGDRIDVVKVPMGMGWQLVQKDLVSPLATVISAAELAEVRKTYFLLNLATFENKLYYIPRKFETRIMVYLKSKVGDAVLGWQGYRKQIDSLLHAASGRGLPVGYTLEDDPGKWDYVDILVAGYFWANTEYQGEKKGRIAHRGKNYSGTALGLMDRCFQAGAEKGELLRLSSGYFSDVLAWESMYTASGVYPPAMWEQQWSGTDLWDAFKTGTVFCSFLTQLDCFFLHRQLPHPDDLGFAVMPRFVSLDGTKKGGRSISTGGWLWGISAGSTGKKEAFELIGHLTSYGNQILEYNQFGIIPVRKDVIGKTQVVFQEDWKEAVFTTSINQVKLNGTNALPYSSRFTEIEKRYIEAWHRCVTTSTGGSPLTPAVIDALLNSD